MIKQDLNRQWTFKSSQLPSGIVDLPHDFSILQKRDPDTPAGIGNGYFPGGVGEYQKILFVPEEWRGKKVMLEFEGVYMNATVRINSHIVAQQPYGYTTFHCDLSPYLMYGKDNTIDVHVNNSAIPNTRWYSGSGIYRPVWLMVGEQVHIKPWGVFAAAQEVSAESSTTAVRTEVENSGEAAAAAIVRSTLLDAAGSAVASHEVEVQIPGKCSIEASQTLVVEPARLWSVEDPYLYTLKSEVLLEGKVVDLAETSIGIRSISFDARQGFRLNGVPTKLKGGNVHHDTGLLGAAAYGRAEERKIELLKASGYNAVRCAHNPPSPSFLDACDRLGMLVMDEAFDVWRESKVTNDYHLHFADWWERDLAAMVLRDRNHPSIILWSTGNEIGERDGRSDGYAYARKLADYVRSLDDTRAVTNGICWVGSLRFSPIGIDPSAIPEGFDYWGETTESYAEPLDVVGYNYEQKRYKSDSVKYPDRVICSTENYLMDSLEYWMTADEHPNVIGDFYWTSLDYLGEAGVGAVRYGGEKEVIRYPWHVAYCGDIDICGFKRPQSHYRDCVWEIAKAPYIAVYKPEHYGKNPVLWGWSWPDVVPSWTWPGYEGKPTVVEVYSTDEEIELFLNGTSLGRQGAGKPNKYKAAFELHYEAGELLAVGYRGGSEASRAALRTAEAPAAIRLTPDRSRLEAEFGDLSYITVEVVDASGNVVHDAADDIYFTACGAGTLIAVGNSNPVSEEMYVGHRRKAYEGRAMAVVRADGESGEIVLTAMAEGIPASTVAIAVG
ncbi:glycoside hydrolase family 2 TIM barrel-domain containing protein [Paenibacillus sp. FSL W8-1187]|uniref:glycoside hydrolase family 2 TIM barrel-domain containing protein n=1 Tax=Paenibacillus sp. FSL W8-1187 TaxID=2975339 RepID=UPI0030D93B0F